MKKFKVFFTLFLLLTIIAACKQTKEPAISIVGIAEKTYTDDELSSHPSITIEYTGKDGDITEYTGVPITELLTDAGVDAFESLTLITGDEYSATVTSDEIADCTTCILSKVNEEGWKAVMPGFSGKAQVKNVVILEVK